MSGCGEAFERDVAGPPDLAPDDPPVIFERLFKITTPDGTEETNTPDEACDLIASKVAGLSESGGPALRPTETFECPFRLPSSPRR